MLLRAANVTHRRTGRVAMVGVSIGEVSPANNAFSAVAGRGTYIIMRGPSAYRSWRASRTRPVWRQASPVRPRYVESTLWASRWRMFARAGGVSNGE